MMSISVSLILATYEMPEHLRLVLEALKRQSKTNFEILLCDDGSSESTRSVIAEFQNFSLLPLHHFWQENKGFRKCRILNEAIRASNGELLVFLDADCIPHKDFIRDHWEAKEIGRYCAGRRIELSEALSKQINVESVQQGFFNGLSMSLLMDGIKGRTQRINRILRIKNPLFRKLFGLEKIDDLKGCNFSVFRSDLFLINGFDEDYEGYGREDTDVEYRLQNLGLKIKSLKGLALQTHVWHPRRNFTPKNDDRLEHVKQEKKIRCKNGLVKE